jgi:hypothetical protein
MLPADNPRQFLKRKKMTGTAGTERKVIESRWKTKNNKTK